MSQLELFSVSRNARAFPLGKEFRVDLGGEERPVEVIRRPRAKRYRLSITADGRLRLTIPRGGNVSQGLEFVCSKKAWISRSLSHFLAKEPAPYKMLLDKSQLLLGGKAVSFTIDEPFEGQVTVHVGDVSVRVHGGACQREQMLVTALWKYAWCILPPRLAELAKICSCSIAHVAVRDQRSRWGSCTSRGGISLNWRLVQMPHDVSDYIMIHELMHTRVMNHSDRFWQQVALHCPQYENAERWLKMQSGLLLPKTSAVP